MAKLKAVSKIIIFVLIAAILLWLNNYYGWSQQLTQDGDFTFLRDITGSNQTIGIIVYIIVTIVGCVLLALPGVTFAVIAGMIFGPWLGIAACLVATTLGAMAAFIAGRFFLRDGVKPLLEKNRTLKKFIFSGNQKNDLILLMVTRLVPLFPYNLQNFAYGITDISFWKYSLYTFIFMFPGVSFFTIGAAGISAESDNWAYFLTAGVIAAGVTLLGMFIQKKYLGDGAGCEDAIIVFTRVPLAGRTKTRLMPFLSGEECAKLHSRIIARVYANCRKVDADIIVCYTPEDKEKLLKKIITDSDIELIAQTGEDLGERMGNAFKYAFNKQYKKVVLIGTDIPDISPEILENAFCRLDENDLVINPTMDGGFYLLGMKDGYTDCWQIDEYGNSSVFEATMDKLEKSGIRVCAGEQLQDIDTKEDLLAYYEKQGGCAEDGQSCIHCGACTRACSFLEKYNIDLKGLAEHPELAYSCFLCGRCKEVCPKDIDGAAIALNMRARQMELGSVGSLGKGYGGILFEKSPYKFANYKSGGCRTVIFPGCNFPAFFPATMDKVEELAGKHGFAVVYDCCQKPVKELGMFEDAEKNLQTLRNYIKENNVEEIVTLCPNCYHTLKDIINIPVRSIYDKLQEIGEGQKIHCDNLPLYLPCPERSDNAFYKDIEAFVEGSIQLPYKDVECCGLGGCAGIREPELARAMVEKTVEMGQPLYTYCASCISNFKRKGKEDAYHMLPMILGVDEKVPLGIKPTINRLMRKF